MREGDFVFSPDLMPNDNFVDIVELIPVFILILHVPEHGLEFRSSRDGHVKSLSGEETLLIKEVEVVLIDQIT